MQGHWHLVDLGAEGLADLLVEHDHIGDTTGRGEARDVSSECSRGGARACLPPVVRVVSVMTCRLCIHKQDFTVGRLEQRQPDGSEVDGRHGAARRVSGPHLVPKRMALLVLGTEAAANAQETTQTASRPSNAAVRERGAKVGLLENAVDALGLVLEGGLFLFELGPIFENAHGLDGFIIRVL